MAGADFDDGRQVFPANSIRPVFGTCWSMLDDSDTLWRAYS
jgi:hypothetical protein